MALYCRDGGLSALVDSDCDTSAAARRSASIPPATRRDPAPVSVLQLGLVVLDPETDLQVCASTKHATVAGDDYTSHSVVDTEHGKGLLQLYGHGVREGIVFSGAVQCQEDHRCWRTR